MKHVIRGPSGLNRDKTYKQFYVNPSTAMYMLREAISKEIAEEVSNAIRIQTITHIHRLTFSNIQTVAGFIQTTNFVIKYI